MLHQIIYKLKREIRFSSIFLSYMSYFFHSCLQRISFGQLFDLNIFACFSKDRRKGWHIYDIITFYIAFWDFIIFESAAIFVTNVNIWDSIVKTGAKGLFALSMQLALWNEICRIILGWDFWTYTIAVKSYNLQSTFMWDVDSVQLRNVKI